MKLALGNVVSLVSITVKIDTRLNNWDLVMTLNVEIYTWSSCPFCLRAKALLNQKGVDYQEYAIDGDEVARQQMAQRAHGRRSLPQIFINDQHIGGCDGLYDLEANGELDKLLVLRSVA